MVRPSNVLPAVTLFTTDTNQKMRCLAALLAAPVTALNFSAAWRDCALYSSGAPSTVRAECADITVPVCYPGICSSDKTLSLFVKRIPSDVHPAKAVWFLQGGPGLPSTNMEATIEQAFTAANGTMSVYTMDHRGTGRSSRLEDSCIDTPDAETCFTAVRAKYGAAAPVAFSVTSAAADLAALIQGPMLADSDVFVYGVSYGTYWVERLMHLSPSNVRGYILDSVVGEAPVKLWSDWDLDVVTTEIAYYARCDKDAFCASKIGPKSRDFALQLLHKLDANDTECAQAIYGARGTPSAVVGAMLSSLFRVSSQRNMIPAVLFRLRGCLIDYSPHAAFVDRLVAGAIAPPSATGSSKMLYNTVVFSEFWPSPLPSAADLLLRARQSTWSPKDAAAISDIVRDSCAYTGSFDAACTAFPRGNTSFVYPHDAYWNTTAAVPGGASVLLLASDLDIQTIPRYAVAEDMAMGRGRHQLLRFPFGGHSVLLTTPTTTGSCGARIVNQFLATGGDLTALNTSCIATMVPLQFKTVTDAAKATALFGSATDMYTDAPVQTVAVAATSGGASANDDVDIHVLAGAGAVLGVALAIAGVASVQSWRRLHRTPVPQTPQLAAAVVAVMRRASVVDAEECKDDDDGV
ncbi:serine protease family S33 [Achlya hypogyna]|uniref:Serine protease family S33 n=1 Tax=Achlya hypogyna TaxID=1202772 RepID=A0A1V9ZNJ9_ACHHY|nr:serine protease family S33 [Achlya hypogyna]